MFFFKYKVRRRALRDFKILIVLNVNLLKSINVTKILNLYLHSKKKNFYIHLLTYLELQSNVYKIRHSLLVRSLYSLQSSSIYMLNTDNIQCISVYLAKNSRF